MSIKRKRSDAIKGFPKDRLPTVSVIVPVYNERKVIPTRIKNLKDLNYPKDRLEVVFVDSGSVDGTADLIEQSAADAGLSIKLVQQGSRKGFNSAVIDGFAQTTGDLIIITGAESEFDPEALQLLVRHFADEHVGAVNGRQQIKNSQEGMSPKVEVAYRNIYDFIREAESCIDSPFDIKGEIAMARRSVVQRLVENSEMRYKGCIDACVSFQAKKDGYKTDYDPDAVYYELSPRSMRDSFKQQIRRAAVLIENMLAFKNLMFKRKYGAFGTLIMPAHFLMLVVLPYLLLFVSVAAVALIVLSPSNLLFPLIGVVGILGTFLLRSVQAFVKTQIALIAATLKLVFGTETQKFELLQSTRPTESEK
jgi:cellulose synthase/poly-beta-1,6-N-acetylglucosamine synthase-like glycosyltransferase